MFSLFFHFILFLVASESRLENEKGKIYKNIKWDNYFKILCVYICKNSPKAKNVNVKQKAYNTFKLIK